MTPISRTTATTNIFGEIFTGREAIQGRIQSTIDVGTQIERVSDVITNGEFATTFTEWTNELGQGGTDMSVFQLENGLIKGHWEFLLPDWPPTELGG